MKNWEKKYQEKAREWAKYRWEFMRRSPEYRADYKKAMAAKKNAKRVYNEDFQAWEIIGDIEEQLASKYNLPGKMIDPDISYEELLEKEKHYDRETPNFFTTMPKSVIDTSNQGAFYDPTTLVIEIDFSIVNSIAAVKEHVKNLIDDFYEVGLATHQIEDKKNTI